MEHIVVQGVITEIKDGAAKYRELLEAIEHTKKEQTLVASRLALLRKLLILEGEQVDEVGTFGTTDRL